MDATPRLRSAFPGTPQTDRRRPPPRYGGSDSAGLRASRPAAGMSALKSSTASGSTSDPLIPDHVLDAPSQRLFAFSLWVLLQTWKIWDFVNLQESEDQSLWLFMKWLAIDGGFLYGLPSMRIPWLEWSPSTMTMLFCFHAIVDGMLMFRIPIPLGAGFAAVGRGIWGAYELAITEHSVNPQAIMFNESLILGRQVIRILPEGSAVLNPDHEAFCIDATRTEVHLPIKINSTNPVSMELVRFDLEADTNETISISKSQIKAMHRDASRLLSYSDKPNEPKTLYYAVKKPGLYVLAKVVDESNLEVARKHLAHTPVVPCPRAVILPSALDRCKGELSDIDLEVVGTPPLRVTYRKRARERDTTATFEGIMPEDFFSPLTKQDQGALVLPKRIENTWARTRRVRVPLSETLAFAGKWAYSIDEVKDGFGNTVAYSKKDHEGQEKNLAKSSHLHQVITVHERPTISYENCSPQNPRKAAKDNAITLPLKYGSTNGNRLENTVYQVDYVFTPDGDQHGTSNAVTQQRTLSSKNPGLDRIVAPGLYTLTGVSTEFCAGEVLESASCLLQNPPRPQLSIKDEQIFDECAGRTIGLRVDFDLVGTPPFEIFYRITNMDNGVPTNMREHVPGLRGQVNLTPKQAGHYKYDFVEIKDAVYGIQKLQGLTLEQDVKPSASARFAKAGDRRALCIEESASFDVDLHGEGPFNLEYELIHAGQRTKHVKSDVEQGRIDIGTGHLGDGGEYTLALTSITDRMGCKEFLAEEAKVSVRHQKPKVGFGHIDGRRSLNMLDGRTAELPLRLAGDRPWTVKYTDAKGREHSLRTENANERISVTESGVYELLDVRDAGCPGVVDESAKTFEITWIPRPELRVPSGDRMERHGDTLVRADVCEGDEDAVEVLFKGSGPFQAQYVQEVHLAHGTVAPKKKELRSAVNVGTLLMDTSQAGLYEYTINRLKDNNYEPSPKHFNPTTVKQRVHPKPSAAFANPHKTYSYCSVESEGEEVIPVTLSGQPPFNLEVEIRHHSNARTETVNLNGITGHKHDIRIPHNRLQEGKSTVSLRRVSDDRGCARSLDPTALRVQIAVHDPPTITPLESTSHFCVGDRLNYALTGAAPFTIFYTFEGTANKAVAATSTFRRLAERPGEFVITGVQDSASSCRAATHLAARVHGLPSARVSHGRDAHVDIHEGGSAEILFEFGGEPPFEFSYTRSANAASGARQGGGGSGVVLDLKSEVSDGHSLRILAHEEGTYEVVAVKDRFCAYAKAGVKKDLKEAQKRIGY